MRYPIITLDNDQLLEWMDETLNEAEATSDSVQARMRLIRASSLFDEASRRDLTDEQEKRLVAQIDRTLQLFAANGATV